VLDQVEVAGRYAETHGERLLGQASLGAQSADRPPDQSTGHDLHPLQIASLSGEDNHSIAQHPGRFGMHFASAM
jgi:hypothetical protein